MLKWGWINPASGTANLVDAFQRCGKALFMGQLNNSHSGNLSVRDGEHIYVSRTRSMCHEIKKEDIIKTTFSPTSEDLSQVSREFIVHRAIYEATEHRAVVHCHPTVANALALVEDVIIPLQIEGYGAIPGRIPVLEVGNASASPDLCEKLAPMLKETPAVMVRGHGLFVAADSLDQATHRAFVVEDAARMIVTARNMGAELSLLRSKPYIKAGYKPVT